MEENKSLRIGIVGWWNGVNYGSTLTTFALYKFLEDNGFGVSMVRPASATPAETIDSGISEFAKKHYSYTIQCLDGQMKMLNNDFDTFIVASDQLWNYPSFIKNGYLFMLNFVNDDKKKIAYSTSFGANVSRFPETSIPKAKSLLDKFDFLSVREKSGVEILRDVFSQVSVQVPDPVFLCNPNRYRDVSEDSAIKQETPYIFAYILDPNDSKREIINRVSAKYDKKIVAMTDPQGDYEKRISELSDYEFVRGGVPEWLWHIINCDFAVVDSFHGMCFALLFGKPFVAINNAYRGTERFISLLSQLEMNDYLVENVEQFEDRQSLFENFDFEKISKFISIERERGGDWLLNACNDKQTYASILQENSQLKKNMISISDKLIAQSAVKPKIHHDVNRCRVVVSLLKQYGIKQVVIAPGTRHLSLVRLFEHESNGFICNYVADERSAGFFAIGLATSLSEPVAIVCTSGTAVCNFLSAMTEAFYQQVPLALITADRYASYVGQMEEQTIPQTNFFKDVCKKAVALPVDDTPLAEWESRRLVCEALLEMTHHGDGPVQINVPIVYLGTKQKLPLDSLTLPQVKKIFRHLPNSPKSTWDNIAKVLSESPRILIIWGQQPPISDAENEILEKFLDKYNAVLTCHVLSNVKSDRAIYPYNLANAEIKNSVWQQIDPKIVITVGNLDLFQTLKTELRASKQAVHWYVNADGVLRDPFRKLKRIFECTPQYFFKRLTEIPNVQSLHTDYKENWLNIIQNYPPKAQSKKFTTRYTVQNTLANIPDNSLLHIANSSTIRFANEFPLNKTLTVFCNRGTNGIDGSASSFMGQVAATPEEKLCFLLIGDLSFFYDMNSIWNKRLTANVRILLSNDNGAGLLRGHKSPGTLHAHTATAVGWAQTCGFEYLRATTKEEFDEILPRFLAEKSDKPLFFEVIV